jgi:SAM-dependent methyltransferase
MPGDLVTSVFSGKKPLTPPRRLVFTGAGDFKRTGEMFLQDFISNKLIEKDSSVLDIGSGIGRIAIPLTLFLEQGKYDGFDIMKPGIQWCQKNITSRFPNFKFTQVALSNDLYRNSGQSASQFEFPYPDEHFDLAVATSVFTHMLPAEVIRYVEEIHRVIKKGGHAYLTFFVLNPDSMRQMKEGENEFNFQYDHGTYRLLDEKVKSANVAYDEKYLFDSVIFSSKFTTKSIEYGTWSTMQKGSPISFQDRLVITKK